MSACEKVLLVAIIMKHNVPEVSCMVLNLQMRPFGCQTRGHELKTQTIRTAEG